MICKESRVFPASRGAGAALVVALALVSTPLAAHHSPVRYELREPIAVAGTITAYDWAFPHVYLYVAEDRSDRVWEVETHPAPTMKRAGWSADTLTAGDRVVVTGFPGKNAGAGILLLTRLERGAAILYPGFEAIEATTTATSIAGTWVVELTESVSGRFLDRTSWSPTESGREALRRRAHGSWIQAVSCRSATLPTYMLLPVANAIEVSDSKVVIRNEYEGVVRVVHLDVDSHAGAAWTRQGHSIGWWDGEALVVETTRFSRDVGDLWPAGTERRYVERFSLDPGGASLTYEFTFEDPEWFAAPFTGTLTWRYRPDREYAPVACDLGNARRFLDESEPRR